MQRTSWSAKSVYYQNLLMKTLIWLYRVYTNMGDNSIQKAIWEITPHRTMCLWSLFSLRSRTVWSTVAGMWLCNYFQPVSWTAMHMLILILLYFCGIGVLESWHVHILFIFELSSYIFHSGMKIKTRTCWQAKHSKCSRYSIVRNLSLAHIYPPLWLIFCNFTKMSCLGFFQLTLYIYDANIRLVFICYLIEFAILHQWSLLEFINWEKL